jgi:hypothetical protein
MEGQAVAAVELAVRVAALEIHLAQAQVRGIMAALLGAQAEAEAEAAVRPARDLMLEHLASVEMEERVLVLVSPALQPHTLVEVAADLMGQQRALAALVGVVTDLHLELRILQHLEQRIPEVAVVVAVDLTPPV